MANGGVVVLEDGLEGALRLALSACAQDFNPDDALLLLSMFARDCRRRWGPEVCHRIEIAVRTALHDADPRATPRLAVGAPDTTI